MWQFTGKGRPSFAVEPTGWQESVWDYPRPPICVADQREVIVRCGDLLIARTRKAIRVLETASPPSFYVPPIAVNAGCLRRAPGSSFCEWKGAATYWLLDAAGQQIANVGWSYESPPPRFAHVANYLSFYPGKLECTVGGELVRPQPGGFYGGWVTDEIIGPYKGEPGTTGW
jgi:uncharacterized protein (DUF427 family)